MSSVKAHDQGRRRTEALPALHFQKGSNGVKVSFHNSIVCNFMIYQVRIETNELQLFSDPENSEWFSIISVIIFVVNIVDEQKQTQLVTIFL